MLPETDRIDFATIDIPRVRRGPWGYLKIGAALLAIGGAAWAWQAGYRPPLLAQESKTKVEFVEIDRGDVELSVVETGSVESANNTTVRCQVEALLGLVGGSQGTASGKGAGGGMGQGAGGQGGSAAGGAGGGQAAAATPTKTAKSKTTKKAGGSTAGGTSSSGGTSASASSSSPSGSGSAGSTGSSGSSTGSTGTTTAGSKPVIRSFTYAVALHVPLRPVTAKAADTTTQKQTQPQGGGRGGGGRRGGRGGGGMGGQDEKLGSTTIVDIIPDGSKVKAGDFVCRLDSSAFEDEEKAQLIRYLQAKSYVEQANAILEVNLITLREYRDGIYPQDVQLIRQYVQTCQLECDRLERGAAWSRDMQKKGYRTTNQVKGDVLAFEKAKIALGEATNMIERLTKQTGPKLLKSLEANVRAIESDKFLQDASFSLEEQRLKRIRKNIKNCTLLAPRDGIVVYANETSRWGQVTAQIDQGVTVRQDQPIFNLPDPKHMRVKARINESKFAMVHTGQVVKIVVDAYPERALRGRVEQVAAINTPLNASDVKIYYANVDIIDEFDDLRPGLSAQVVFNIDVRRAVTRVPLESIRWVGAEAYVALYDRPLAEAGKNPWSWRKIELGLSDSRYAEVVSGIQAGDRVVASPLDLPEPANAKRRRPATSVAGLAP
ncbi:MAG: efflux RND transporter periplasmic adaptor subunit [Isosphaerales bacterium]